MGSRLDDKAQARWFADHGYLVVSVDYSLSDAEHHNWDLQKSQIACALAWVNENAARYGGDSTRLGLTGSSAGGNLASNVASKIASGHLRSSCGGTVPTVRAVASLYGATDLVSIYHHSDPQVRNGLQEMAVHYTGGTPTQYPERYASVATLNSATSKTPPTLWVYGDSDALVPPSSMDAMVEVLQERGVDSHGIRIPQANHGLDFRNPAADLAPGRPRLAPRTSGGLTCATQRHATTPDVTAGRPHGPRRAANRPIRMVRGLWLAGSLGLGLLALAQLVTIPVVDFFGGVLVVAWARAALGAGILLCGCLWLAVPRRTTVLRVLAAAAAGLALVYYATAGARLLGWARDNGVHVPASSVFDYAQVRDVPDQTLHYTDIDGNDLPIASYLPESPRNASVVVHIHGGAWNSGSYLATGHNRWLAEHGHLVYSIEYTLSDATHHQWDKVVGQLQCGIARAAQDAAAHGADASRVQLTGESAGGHLALLTAYSMPATSPCGTRLPTVTAVAVTYPAADLGLLDDLDPALRQVTLHRSRSWSAAHRASTPTDTASSPRGTTSPQLRHPRWYWSEARTTSPRPAAPVNSPTNSTGTGSRTAWSSHPPPTTAWTPTSPTSLPASTACSSSSGSTSTRDESL
ncbi:MAG TPA: alpha/beta hydrolase fold domain-containing protein [Candidatus Luteococcus avicola]|nr:alpha/beta hydrolase fold domain-containing protein [Candidatus Luteococcus avicola]